MSLNVLDAPSPNQDARPGGAGPVIDTLILHYTGMQSAAAAVARLRDPASRVSSHYVVDEDGSVLRLVPEAARAWHAGVSYWRGRSTLNDVSIGIEIVNPGHEWRYREFPPAQMQAVRALCLEILGRHPISPRHVVGHSDVAPDRKQDPGELFDWRGLAEAGIGWWPPAGVASDARDGDAASLLAAIGYDPRFETATLLRAFQRHWRPEQISGLADAATLAALRAVA